MRKEAEKYWIILERQIYKYKETNNNENQYPQG